MSYLCNVIQKGLPDETLPKGAEDLEKNILQRVKAPSRESGIDNYQIVDFMEQYETNTDIADVILGEAVREPNHHTFPSQVPYLRRKSSIVITK